MSIGSAIQQAALMNKFGQQVSPFGAPASAPGVAPSVPADGAMPPTIGPGMPPGGPVAGSGGLLAMLQSRMNPQGGISELLKRLSTQAPGSAPMAAPPAGAGMLGGPLAAGPSSIGAGLPMNIKPMDMF